jgi:hypothetical protein
MQSSIINDKQPLRREQPMSQYHVFLVRLWPNSSQDPQSIRISAENTRTGQRFGFTNWEDLSQYLQKHINDSSP